MLPNPLPCFLPLGGTSVGHDCTPWAALPSGRRLQEEGRGRAKYFFVPLFPPCCSSSGDWAVWLQLQLDGPSSAAPVSAPLCLASSDLEVLGSGCLTIPYELPKLSSVQFSSVTQSCPTLCHPMNHSTPGLPVHHQLPEFTQTHVHRVSDAIQPSHSLSSPSPPAPNPSQHQSLFQ